MSIAVLVLFFERPQQTIECLESFLPSGVPIYVLNNGSSANSTQSVVEYVSSRPQIRLFSVPRNLGVSAGRNYLMRKTNEEWMFFVDSDAVVKTSEWKQLLEANIESHPSVEAFVPNIFNRHDNKYMPWPDVVIEKCVLRQVPRPGPETNIFPGTSIVKRSLFERVGYFDEALFVGYEDLELAVRALKIGEPVRCLRVFEIELIHEHRAASTWEDRNAAHERYKLKTIQNSFSHIVRKHDIVWDDAWEKWIKREKRRIVGSMLSRFVERLKAFL